MNRKHFLQLSGLSLAALIISNRSVFAHSDGQELISIPDEVSILSGDNWITLKPVGDNRFTYRDITARITHEAGAVRITVVSPTQSLEALRLAWNTRISGSSKLLGDHWERTYGDVSWQAPVPGKKMPWYFLQADEKGTNCFGVRTGGNTIACWQLTDSRLELNLDTRCGGRGVHLGARELQAADILTMSSQPGESPFTTGKRFCAMMCSSPRLAKQPVYGINDWYFAYGKNSYDLILQHTLLFSDLVTDTNNRPFSVIDAGWAQSSPALPDDCCWQNDAAIPNDKFRDMHKMALAILQAGMRPGIWVRPLCAKFDDKKSLLLAAIPGRDQSSSPILDPSIPENLERIRGNIKRFGEWGYEMIKHDYTTYDLLGKWGFEMNKDITTPGWKFYQDGFTTAEIMLQLYSAIREAAGARYLIGCNTMSHLSAGIFELNRIGDDTSGQEWDRTRKMMGVNTLLPFRAIQHNHLYAADADCVGLTTAIPWSKNKQWMQLLAESGTPLFISGQPAAVGAEQKKFISECFSIAAKKRNTPEPLDWLTNPRPAEWNLDGVTRKFDWS